MPDIQEMIGKEVEVIANGMSYRGVLIEVSDAEVHLKGMMQWISLPASSVSVIKPVETARPAAERVEEEETVPESAIEEIEEE